MIVHHLRHVETPEGWRVSAEILSDRGTTAPFHLEYLVRGAHTEWLSQNFDAFAAAALMPAMALREDLIVDGPVSATLLRNLREVSAIYRRWNPSLAPVRVLAKSTATSSPGSGTALFFSGGVDSFYSLLKNVETGNRITHLLLVFGFDVKLTNRPLFEKIAATVAEVAAANRMELLLVETNVRSFSDRLITWDLYHGGPMASVGLALAGLLRRCIIASTYAYAELHPWGSHPLVDPLWSTESLEFTHDGCEALRSVKIQRIARSPLALKNLRVCWRNEQSQYNCGSCEKCVRTMIGLHLAGALGDAATFKQALTPRLIRKMGIASESSERFLDDLLSRLGGSPFDRKLATAIRHAIRVRRLRLRVGAVARRCFGQRASLARLQNAFAISPRPRVSERF